MSTAAVFTVDSGTREPTSQVTHLRSSFWIRTLCTVLTDLLALFAASVCTSYLLQIPVFPLLTFFHVEQLVVPLALLCCAGLYSGVPLHPSVELRKLVCTMALASVVLAITGPGVSVAKAKAAVCAGFLFRAVFVTLGHTLIRAVLTRCGCWLTPVLLVGSGALAREVTRSLEKHKYTGLNVVASLARAGHVIDGNPCRFLIDQYEQAAAIARKHRIGDVIIADADLLDGDLEEVTCCYQTSFNRVLFVSSHAAMGGLTVKASDLGGFLSLQVTRPVFRRTSRISKRAFDIAGACFLGVCTLPIFVIAYLAIRITSPGPVFYGQRRIGRDGKHFTAWKFRSMVLNADEVLREHLAKDSSLKQEWELTQKLRKDPRILAVGGPLRKSSVDELPQLWNVIRGDMSLVGPRPIVDSEVSKYGQSFDYYKAVRPGLTGLWQISGRSNTSYAERVWYDEYFVKNWSIWLDCYILFRTIKTVALREGAC